MKLHEKMEEAALKTNTTGQDMQKIAAEVIAGAAADVRVDEQAAFNMMTRNQDPVWHKADDAINGERHKLQALSSSVSTGISQQKKVASGFGGRASSYTKAVDTFGPSSQEMLDEIGGKITALQEAVKGYGPALTSKAKENYDKLWGDVEEALNAFKERNANLDSEEALALYEKLKKMRPKELDLSEQYDTVVAGLQDASKIAALRDNFTATAEAAAQVEQNGLEKAEQNAWKAASEGGEGMKEIGQMLDGVAAELHAKAHMADAVANGVGQKLMGQVMDANRAAQQSGQDVANQLGGDERDRGPRGPGPRRHRGGERARQGLRQQPVDGAQGPHGHREPGGSVLHGASARRGAAEKPSCQVACHCRRVCVRAGEELGSGLRSADDSGGRHERGAGQRGAAGRGRGRRGQRPGARR